MALPFQPCLAATDFGTLFWIVIFVFTVVTQIRKAALKNQAGEKRPSAPQPESAPPPEEQLRRFLENLSGETPRPQAEPQTAGTPTQEIDRPTRPAPRVRRHPEHQGRAPVKTTFQPPSQTSRTIRNRKEIVTQPRIQRPSDDNATARPLYSTPAPTLEQPAEVHQAPVKEHVPLISRALVHDTLRQRRSAALGIVWAEVLGPPLGLRQAPQGRQT